MSSGAKITFGNNAATSYSLNTNPNFAYQSGEKITTNYSPYTLGQTNQNAITTTSYATYEAPKQSTFVTNYHAQPYSTSFSSAQVTTPVAASYEVGHTVAHAAPATKVTFGGGKSFNTNFAPTNSTYQTNNYQYSAPASVVQYQTYQTYQQPVQITSQPIRTEVRQEVVREEVRVEPPKVEAVSEVRKSQVKTSAVETAVAKPKKEKGGCPKWLWPLLGILALLALIIGLLFGLGVFGRVGGDSPTITTGGSSTAAAGTTGTVSGGASAGTVTGGSATADASGGVTGTTTGGSTSGVTSPTGYTVIEETVVLSNDNTTSTTGITTPTVNAPTVTVPTVDVNVPTVDSGITTVTDDGSFSLDPVGIDPIEVITTVPTTTTTSWSTTTTTGASSSDASTVSGTTLPTPTWNGYGSNPALSTSTITTSSTVPVSTIDGTTSPSTN